jgi:riboflavin kinase/FMN adenylyltransferase
MQLYRNLDFKLPENCRSVVTIGNFDGLHIGHQALIRETVAACGADQQSVLVSFHPLPGAFFSPTDPPSRLLSRRKKISLAANLGLDLMWLLRFNSDLASMDPEAFVRQLLVDALKAERIIVGEDFRFGRQRKGNVQLLRAMGDELGFAVNTLAAVTDSGERVSSSNVRSALARGDLDTAARLLGRPYSLEGRVQRGRQLGRDLGYPTANIPVSNLPCPVNGIFAVRCRIGHKKEKLPGVASIGYRPTLGDNNKLLLEVHLFDFDADLYGLRMEVDLVERIRDEEYFASLDSLVEQMQHDEAQARSILQATKDRP